MHHQATAMAIFALLITFNFNKRLQMHKTETYKHTVGAHGNMTFLTQHYVYKHMVAISIYT